MQGAIKDRLAGPLLVCIHCTGGRMPVVAMEVVVAEVVPMRFLVASHGESPNQLKRHPHDDCLWLLMLERAMGADASSCLSVAAFARVHA